jgi:hypothetical protein
MGVAPALDERPVDPDDLLSSRKVRAACGGWSDMTLWRNSHHPNPEIAFPAPDIVLNGRKYWRRRTVEAWRTRQAERTASGASASARLSQRRHEAGNVQPPKRRASSPERGNV